MSLLDVKFAVKCVTTELLRPRGGCNCYLASNIKVDVKLLNVKFQFCAYDPPYVPLT